MKTPGVLVNADAGRVRRDPELLGWLHRMLPAEHIQVTTDVQAVEPALRTLRELDVDTLVVIGGDGTVGGTLTPLLRVWADGEPPAIALLAGGTVNTIARALGSRDLPQRALGRLLEEAPLRPESTRPALCIQPEEGEMRCGMIFGNGVTTRWLEAYYGNARQGPLGALQVIGRAVGSALTRGELASGLFQPFPATCEIDGERLDLSDFTVMGASGVRDVGLGFQPFRTAGSDPERIHFLATDAGPLRMSVHLPGLWFGMSDSMLRHASARRIRLRFEQALAWSVDADLFPPTHGLEITPSRPLRFLSP